MNVENKKERTLKKYLPENTSIGKIESFLKGVGHRTRIEILYFLYNNPESELKKISEFINSTQQNTTSHVQKMMNGGLLLKKQNGNLVLHKLSKKGDEFVVLLKRFFRN